MNRERFWRRPQAVALTAALAFGIGGAGFAASKLESTHPAAVLKLANPNDGPSKTGFAPVVKEVLPTVVSVSSTKVSKIPTQFDQFPDDPMFRQFFGRSSHGNAPREAPEQRERGLGSGVIMTS